MKNATWLVLIFFLSFPPAMAQKLDSILSKSTLSFNYGLSYDYFACCADKKNNLPITNLDDRKTGEKRLDLNIPTGQWGKMSSDLGFPSR
jgi:hypothetical protein